MSVITNTTKDNQAIRQPRFRLGAIYMTPGIVDAVPYAEVLVLLLRHRLGDWGEVDEEDKRENELSLKRNYRLLSAYTTQAGVKVWIITEADRSATTILLPEEY